MALLPTTPESSDDKKARMQAAQDEALLREIDDAYRQGQYSEFAQKFGKPLLGVLLAGLAAFGGYLFWDSRQEAAKEKDSEQIVAALDQIQAGNLDTGAKSLEEVAKSSNGGAAAMARLLQAGVMVEQGKAEEATKVFAEVAGDSDAPQQVRNLATIRELALTFDKTDPAQVIARLQPIAVPGDAWFGSAGELVALAYLKQGKKAEAGALFAEIAKAKDTPSSLRSRARQMAGVLGVDAIEDVDKLMAEQQQGNEATAASGE